MAARARRAAGSPASISSPAPGLGYFLNPETPTTAEQWLAGAERHEGAWWEHYAAWLAERSAEQVAAPQSLGSGRYPPIEPAPGSYINQ